MKPANIEFFSQDTKVLKIYDNVVILLDSCPESRKMSLLHLS